jgi:hypothetical protein
MALWEYFTISYPYRQSVDSRSCFLLLPKLHWYFNLHFSILLECHVFTCYHFQELKDSGHFYSQWKDCVIVIAGIETTGFGIPRPWGVSSKTGSVLGCLLLHTKTSQQMVLKTSPVVVYLVVLWVQWAKLDGSSTPHGVDWGWNSWRTFSGLEQPRWPLLELAVGTGGQLGAQTCWVSHFPPHYLCM